MLVTMFLLYAELNQVVFLLILLSLVIYFIFSSCVYLDELIFSRLFGIPLVLHIVIFAVLARLPIVTSNYDAICS